jgi:hypothetical protein
MLDSGRDEKTRYDRGGQCTGSIYSVKMTGGITGQDCSSPKYNAGREPKKWLFIPAFLHCTAIEKGLSFNKSHCTSGRIK